jgi:hypothetical protein
VTGGGDGWNADDWKRRSVVWRRRVGLDVGRVALAGRTAAITKLNRINLVLKLTEIFA